MGMLLLFALAGDTPAERFATAVNSAETLGKLALPSERDRRDFENAVLRLAGDFPAEPIAWYWQGDWQERQRQPGDAAKSWERALTKPGALEGANAAATQARCGRRLAYLRLAVADADGAAKWAAKALDLAPLAPEGYRCLFDVGLRSGDVETPVARLRETLARNPEAAALHAQLHDFQAKTGAWDALRTALDARPADRRRYEDDSHFRALLAELDGDRAEAAAQHLLADWGGPTEASTTKASGRAVRKIRGAEPEKLSAELRALAGALNALDYNQDVAAATAALKALPEPKTPAQTLARQYLRARCATALGEGDALSRWRKLADAAPRFAPGLVGLGEVLEATPAGQAEAERWLQSARALAPRNWKVREHLRMGAVMKPHAEGVLLAEVFPDAAWARFGAKSGDVVVSLDDKPLAKMPRGERMQFARLFAGGDVELRRPGRDPIGGRMEIQLFDD